MANGKIPIDLHSFHSGRWQTADGTVIEERLVSIFVNGVELATIASTPCDQDALALGFLLNEGLIGGLEDVRAVHVCPSGGCVDVWLRTGEFKRPERLILTSGCGGGVTFDDLAAQHPPIESDLRVSPEQLATGLDQLQHAARLHLEAGGVHASALSDGERLLVMVEDIGRHNTIDKLRGLCLLQGIETRDRILLCTGRISSEMLGKARKMAVPIVASRTSPTSLSVELARAWGLTLIGYVRHSRLTVYAGVERVVTEQPAAASAAPASSTSSGDGRG